MMCLICDIIVKLVYSKIFSGPGFIFTACDDVMVYSCQKVTEAAAAISHSKLQIKAPTFMGNSTYLCWHLSNFGQEQFLQSLGHHYYVLKQNRSCTVKKLKKYMSRNMTKPTIRTSAQRRLISPGIHPVRSVFTVPMKEAWVLSYPLSPQWRLIRLGGCPGWSVFAGRTSNFVGFVVRELLFSSFFTFFLWILAQNTKIVDESLAGELLRDRLCASS